MDHENVGTLQGEMLNEALTLWFAKSEEDKHRLLPQLSEHISAILEAFHGEQASLRVSLEAFPSFVVFCQAWRLFQYFETPLKRPPEDYVPVVSPPTPLPAPPLARALVDEEQLLKAVPAQVSNPDRSAAKASAAAASLHCISAINDEITESLVTAQMLQEHGQAAPNRSELGFVLSEGFSADGFSDSGKRTALMRAAAVASASAIGFLLQKGAGEVNVKDNDGSTALFYTIMGQAAVEAKLDAIRLLVSSRADVNVSVPSPEGRCATLDMAFLPEVKKHDPQHRVAQLLVELGAWEAK